MAKGNVARVTRKDIPAYYCSCKNQGRLTVARAPELCYTILVPIRTDVLHRSADERRTTRSDSQLRAAPPRGGASCCPALARLLTSGHQCHRGRPLGAARRLRRAGEQV